ncbi:MAG: helix-turn-helix domain-containing protein [Bacteroidales bacterium]|nr:helix-turn-helix domain-containing protein [Bacteroidales bacterium]
MYHYQEYKSDIRLTPWIENYWLATDFVPSGIYAKVLPDAYADIIFDFDSTKGISRATIFGTMTNFFEVDSTKHTQMFGIRFKPAAITAFTRVPQMELTNRSVELALLETLFDKSFYETFPEKQSAQEIIAHTNNHLIKMLPHLYSPDVQILRAVDVINFTKGQLNLTRLASDICLSQRHFERRFKTAIGVSPKMFAKIIRFTHTIQDIVKYPEKDLLTIALERGYYDGTHLMKEIKSFSGDTPTDVRKKREVYYAPDECYV